MKESYGEDLASHPGPESCVGIREDAGEALTGAHTGEVLSSEIRYSGVPTTFKRVEGNIAGGGRGEPTASPAESKTLSTCGNSLRGKREIPMTPPGYVPGSRQEKADSHTSCAHVIGKSDGCIVPEKPSNEGVPRTSEERVEGRRPTKGNASQGAAFRTQGREDALTSLERVREAARRDRRVRFTALLHHVTVDALLESFEALRREAAPGVDKVTWYQYRGDLEKRLRDLHERVHAGTYRAQPSKRTYIPKPDGRMRPIGIAALEDKIVQHAVMRVLNQIYEADFLGFSYGFRPGRGTHKALDALWVGLDRKRVNWVLDCDIQGFFENLDQ